MRGPFGLRTEVEQRVQQHYGLTHVGSVATTTPVDTLSAAARAAASFLNGLVHDGITLAVAWGTHHRGRQPGDQAPTSRRCHGRPAQRCGERERGRRHVRRRHRLELRAGVGGDRRHRDGLLPLRRQHVRHRAELAGERSHARSAPHHPERLCVAVGRGKDEALAAALAGGYVTHLLTFTPPMPAGAYRGGAPSMTLASASMSARLRVLCQRGMTWFMTYPNATPRSGSA